MNTARLGFFETPLLHYVGSKWSIADWIIHQFPPHQIYVEPFAGSASVFLRKYPSKTEVINDADGELVNFFQVLRSQPEALIYQISLTPWAKQEYELSFEHADDPVERARRYYVRCWQSFGGSLGSRSGWRHNRTVSSYTTLTRQWRRLDGLQYAADRLLDAQISQYDAIECIQHYDTPQTLFYLDPPYVMKARASKGKKRYKHELDDEYHRQLANMLAEVKGYVLVSGYDCPLYDEIFKGWKRLEKSVTTTGNSVSIESLWLSPRLQQVSALPLFAESESE